MTEFEERFLLCDIGKRARQAWDPDTHEISLIPGPPRFDEPFYSTRLQELVEYPVENVARTLTQMDGVTPVDEGGRDHFGQRWQWQRTWRWERPDRFIEVGFSMLADSEPEAWGGSQLYTLCTYADLVRFWRAFQARHPASWLHDERCQMFTPHSFLATYALPQLAPALLDPDPRVRALAPQAIEEYRRLAYRGEIIRG